MSSHLTYFSIHRFSRTNYCVDKMNEYLNLLFLNYGCESLWLLMRDWPDHQECLTSSSSRRRDALRAGISNCFHK